MSAGHTPGLLVVNPIQLDQIATADGKHEVARATILHPAEYTVGNARRLVACWNACEGIPTYALELMTGDLSINNQITANVRTGNKPTSRKAVEYRRERDALLQVLEDLLQAWPHVDPAKTRAAIKQATEATPS